MWYKIYSGLGGGFGGATYQGTYEYESVDEAYADAYRLAVEEYESYEGCHGIMSWQDCYEDYVDSWNCEPEPSEIDDMYQEEIESWICFYIKPATGPDDIDDE